jgi:hypothetical protein
VTRWVVALAIAVGSCGYQSCGYHTTGHADLLPKTLKTICVPPFTNITTRYKLTDRLPEAISREFIARTRYHVVPEPGAADAVLRGAVVNYYSFPTIFDQATGRASAVEMHVVMQISLVGKDGTVLFTRPNFEVRERYEISVNAAAYFEESDAALNRVSQQVAREVVTAILENF